MRSIDIHAHLLPRSLLDAAGSGRDWHGVHLQKDEDGFDVLTTPSLRMRPGGAWQWDVEQRLSDMDSLGVEMQVVSIFPLLYNYDMDSQATLAISRDTNDEIAQMAKAWPQRFSGLATLPMQDVPASIRELERAVGQLGLKGAMLADTVNGRNFDEPEYLPFFQAAEQAGALIMFHQGARTIVGQRISRYHLPNTVGNLVERSLTFAHLVLGGVMDRCPDLKVCLCHGGGYICYGIGRMDSTWERRPDTRGSTEKPPSTYLRRFYFDCLTQSEASLRYLIDTVGADRVVLGTDWPADMAIDWPVSWVLGLQSLNADEKDLILHKNLEVLLGL